MAAPVTAIVAYDTRFYEHLPDLPAQSAAPSWFTGPGRGVAFHTAFRNGSLQGAYLMIAARAIGLDVGAMSGFNNAKVDEAFFPDSRLSRTSSATSATAITASIRPQSPAQLPENLRFASSIGVCRQTLAGIAGIRLSAFYG